MICDATSFAGRPDEPRRCASIPPTAASDGRPMNGSCRTVLLLLIVTFVLPACRTRYMDTSLSRNPLDGVRIAQRSERSCDPTDRRDGVSAVVATAVARTCTRAARDGALSLKRAAEDAGGVAVHCVQSMGRSRWQNKIVCKEVSEGWEVRLRGQAIADP